MGISINMGIKINGELYDVALIIAIVTFIRL